MKISIINLLLLSVILFGCTEQSVKSEENSKEKDVSIIKLDHNLFKIGEIEVDKKGRSFKVSGHFLRQEPPIEFFAVAKEGSRGYESLFELESTVYQFNLACILIGLEQNKGKPPEFHFDPIPLEGDSVEIWVSWQHKGQSFRYEAADFFKLGDTTLTKANWVYTGSHFLPDGKYMADEAGGTLIGFVHDPASIIEHRIGIMGMSELNLDKVVLPPLTTPVTVQIIYKGDTDKNN